VEVSDSFQGIAQDLLVAGGNFDARRCFSTRYFPLSSFKGAYVITGTRDHRRYKKYLTRGANPFLMGAQIRAARGLLGLSQTALSELAGVGIATVKRLELATEVTASGRTLIRIQSALERAGVEFLSADDAHGPSVRLKLPK
jgi:DNA-binding transcriptional regulator YiaG